MTCITTINEQVKKVIEYSQSITNVNPEAMLAKWYDAKQKFIEAWGDYIYESPEPVTFYLSDEEKKHRFNEYIDVVDNTYGNTWLTEFLDWLTIEEVFSNHTTRDFWIDDEEKIPAGTKVIRALKHFESNETVLRKIQDQLSMILQEDKITGTLCLSVHPLDYLSVSENTYHWRSCHALDGDYRAGNLQYMVDKSTIVCYLRGANGQKLPNFPDDVPWNSKKWRMLLFLSENQTAMFAGRQYPFFSPVAMDCVQEVFLTSMNKRLRAWTPWYNDYIKTFPRKNEEAWDDDRDNWLWCRHVCMHGRIYPMKEIIKEPKHPLFFNDLTESSFYIPYYSWNRYGNAEVVFNIGDTVPCPCCGGKHNLDHSELMQCIKCYNATEEDYEAYTYCACCDRRMLKDEAIYLEGPGVYVCEDCATDATTICEGCEQGWFISDIKYDRDAEKHLCPCCRGRIQFSLNDDWLNNVFF